MVMCAQDRGRGCLVPNAFFIFWLVVFAYFSIVWLSQFGFFNAAAIFSGLLFCSSCVSVCVGRFGFCAAVAHTSCSLS